MDLLETQVSDLRQFLGAAAAPQAPEAVSPHDVAYSPGPLRASSHHSSLSPAGDNSAQQPPPSPFDPQRTGPAKRRVDDGDADSSAKQQRSKRNRVGRFSCRVPFILFSLCSGISLTPFRRSTSRLLGKPAPAHTRQCYCSPGRRMPACSSMPLHIPSRDPLARPGGNLQTHRA